MGLILGVILATIFPLLFLGAIYKADFYQIGRYHLVLISLGCGILAYLFASLTNLTLQISTTVDRTTIDLVIAPILEELLKGLAMLTLIRLSRFTFSVDGALYGFATGIGFAILENYEYLFDDPTVAVLVALERIFTANLVHAAGSAIVGMTLGMFSLSRTGSRWLFLAFGLSLAIGLHTTYNNISLGDTSLIGALGMGILGFGFIYLAMQRGRKQAQAWIKQKLGLEDRVTRAEAAVVDRLPTGNDLFRPVLERFGPETASQVEKLLYLEARLGFKRKILENVQMNGRPRSTLETEIHEIRAKIDATRREIGAYAMLFVRGLYTGEIVSVWEQVQAKTQEQSALNDGQKGGGVWSSLEEYLKAQKDIERLE